MGRETSVEAYPTVLCWRWARAALCVATMGNVRLIEEWKTPMTLMRWKSLNLDLLVGYVGRAFTSWLVTSAWRPAQCDPARRSRSSSSTSSTFYQRQGPSTRQPTAHGPSWSCTNAARARCDQPGGQGQALPPHQRPEDLPLLNRPHMTHCGHVQCHPRPAPIVDGKMPRRSFAGPQQVPWRRP